VLDLRRATAPAVRDWLASEQGLGVNDDAIVTLRPSAAFDVLLYLGKPTPARSNAP
jgi:hypothetical protein